MTYVTLYDGRNVDLHLPSQLSRRMGEAVTDLDFWKRGGASLDGGGAVRSDDTVVCGRKLKKMASLSKLGPPAPPPPGSATGKYTTLPDGPRVWGAGGGGLGAGR